MYVKKKISLSCPYTCIIIKTFLEKRDAGANSGFDCDLPALFAPLGEILGSLSNDDGDSEFAMPQILPRLFHLV